MIDRQIDDARAVVVTWSAPALDSTWVLAEATRAHDQRKLVCTHTAGVSPARLPSPFNIAHTVEVTEVERVVAALAALGVTPSGPRRADPTALAWEQAVRAPTVVCLERFLAEYGDAAPALAADVEERLAALEPGRPRRVRAVAVRPEDVILRIEADMHTAPIRRLALSANGRRLATASEDKTVRLWTLPEGRLEKVLRPPIGHGDEGKLYAVAIDPGVRWVACGGMTASRAHVVTVFDAATGVVRARLGPLPSVVQDLEASADGTRLAAGVGGGNGVRVWDTRTWSEAWADAYGNAVYGLSFALDGRLATTCFDGQVRVYAADGRRLFAVRAPGGARPYGVAWAPDGGALAIGYADTPRVDVLDGRDGAPLRAPDGAGIGSASLSSVAWLEGGALAAGGGADGEDCPVFVWADGGAGPRDRWPGPANTVVDLAPQPDGGVAVGSAEPSILALRADGARAMRRGPPIADLRGKLREHFRASPDGQRVWYGQRQRSADPVLFDLAALSLDRCPAPPRVLQPPDTTALPIAGWEGTMAPTLSGAPLALKAHEMSRSMAIAPGAEWFVLGTEWRLRRFAADGRQVWEKNVPGMAWGVNLARAGRLVIAAYGDGTVRWHAAEDGRQLLALFVHVGEPVGEDPAPVEWVAFTPDGYFAASDGGRRLVGWHVNRGPDHAADFYPVEHFGPVFERPDLVQGALDGA